LKNQIGPGNEAARFRIVSAVTRMGRLLEPVSNGRARSMIEHDRTRLTALLLKITPFHEWRGLFFLKVFAFLYNFIN